MKHFFALITREDGSGYGIEFPDLAHVFGAADEEADVLKNAIEALQLAHDAGDHECLTPSTLEEIANRPEVKQALSTGAYLLAVPFIVNDAQTMRVNITLERGMLNAIDASAAARGLTRSAFLAQAARREIEAA